MIWGHNCEYYECWCKTDPKCLCVVLKKMYTVDTKAFSSDPWTAVGLIPVEEDRFLRSRPWTQCDTCRPVHLNAYKVNYSSCFCGRLLLLLDALTVMCTRFMQLMLRSRLFQLWPLCFNVMLTRQHHPVNHLHRSPCIDLYQTTAELLTPSHLVLFSSDQ